MYELIQVGKSTYYIKSPTNIGIYKINDTDVYLIDSGNNKEVGRKILKIIRDNNWNVLGIINTHAHSDHVSGNSFIQSRTSCKIISHHVENLFIKNPILELSYFYGGYPIKDLKNRFLFAEKSDPTGTIENSLPEGLCAIDVKGHSFQMIGIKTSDDVYFLGDSLFSNELIQKHPIILIYNLRDYLETLDRIENFKGSLFIPSHCEALNDIAETVKLNRNKAYEIMDFILTETKLDSTLEELVKKILDHYEQNVDLNSYVLTLSTVKAYLTYLYEENKIKFNLKNNALYWNSNF